MSYLVWLVPIALAMGGIGLGAFFWSVRTGQFEDMEGAGERVLLLDAAASPLPADNEDRFGAGGMTEGETL